MAEVAGQKRRERHEQVENGEREEPLGGAPIRSFTSVQLGGERHEDRSAANSDRSKEQAAKP